MEETPCLRDVVLLSKVFFYCGGPVVCLVPRGAARHTAADAGDAGDAVGRRYRGCKQQEGAWLGVGGGLLRCA